MMNVEMLDVLTSVPHKFTFPFEHNQLMKLSWFHLFALICSFGKTGLKGTYPEGWAVSAHSPQLLCLLSDTEEDKTRQTTMLLFVVN